MTSAGAVTELEAPSANASLDSWLQWLETIHPVAIDMGLDRVGRVADRLNLRPVTKPLILVGGTNGKGSTVAMLSAIYSAAGFRVGAYTSPHIVDFRERISVDGQMAAADDIVRALVFVESGRKPDSLTYFEYTTLAAMRVFQQSECDVYVMEVGLGGRLDATNLWDADCSVIASIALDHQDYLGSDVSVIATEKAAIGRSGKILVLGEPCPPESIFRYAQTQGIVIDHVGGLNLDQLPQTSLSGVHQRRNAGCAVSVVKALSSRLPVEHKIMESALSASKIAARFEILSICGVTVVLDVAHNPAGAEALHDAWIDRFGGQRVQLIFACLADKDLSGIVDALTPLTSAWHCVELPVPRALSLEALGAAVRKCVNVPVFQHADASAACQAALGAARDNRECLLVAGSFHTIALVRQALEGSFDD